MTQPYEIVILGRLPPQWVVAFDGMEIRGLADGNTCIAGSLADQSALYGLLMRLRDFGLTLISVNLVISTEEK